MQMIRLKNPERMGRRRVLSKPGEWRPAESDDRDMNPVRVRAKATDWLFSAVSYALGIGITSWMSSWYIVPVLEPFSMPIVFVLLAYAFLITLTGWVPFICFAVALKPLFEARRQERGAAVMRGELIEADPARDLGELGVRNETGFLQSNRRNLLGAFVATVGSAGGLVALLTHGLVIELNYISGPVSVYGTAFVALVLVVIIGLGLVLPVSWWRRHRLLELAGAESDDYEVLGLPERPVEV